MSWQPLEGKAREIAKKQLYEYIDLAHGLTYDYIALAIGIDKRDARQIVAGDLKSEGLVECQETVWSPTGKRKPLDWLTEEEEDDDDDFF